MSRREALADAALSVVAQGGLKGLTHRAVDTAANVPPGTTSNYWNSRQALIDALATRLEELDVATWQSMTPPTNLDELVAGLARFVASAAGEHPALVRVRLALFLDHPQRVAPGHQRIRAMLASKLEEYGVPDPLLCATRLLELCDGVLLHRVTVRRDPVDVDALVEAVRAILP